MFNLILNATLRLLFFRAGPQDFPYAPPLTRVLVPIALAANYLVFSRVLPLGTSAVMAAAMVGALALATRVLLRTRKLEPRYVQTFHSLLATSSVLTLALLVPFSQVAPLLVELSADPEGLAKAQGVELPVVPAFMMNVLNFWNFAVSAHIYRHATNMNIGIGLLLAFVVAAAVLFAVVFAGSLAGALLGVGGGMQSPL